MSESTNEKIVLENSTVDDEPLLGPEPTPEELETLRKVADRLPISAWFVAMVELSERFTYYGLSGVFTNYMQVSPTDQTQTPGLGLGTSEATRLSNFFQFWCYVTPIPGAIIADSWLGKYATIAYASIIYLVGVLVLFLTSLPVSMRNGHAEGGLIAAMVIIGIGTGGIKANVSTLIADQYQNTKPYIKTLKSGERVIVDPAYTMQQIFHIFYMCINVGSLSAIATTEMEANIDFWAAYLLPFCFFFLALAALFLGRNKYIRRPPQGSPIPNAARIMWLTISSGFARRKVPAGTSLIAQEQRDKGKAYNFTTFLFKPIKPFFREFNLDVAKNSVREEMQLSSVPWSDTFVEEVRRALYACKVFIFFPIYWVVYNQMLNNFIIQAGDMATHGIPNDLMQNIDPIAIIIFIPIMTVVVYPTLKRIGIPFKPVTRIFWGFIFAALAMAYAAIVQKLIYNNGCDVTDPNATCEGVHVAIQTPAYFFIAISEIFASITGLEYAYTHAPLTMKSLIMSLFLFTSALGSILGIALSSVAVYDKYMWMYTGLAIATIIAGFLFFGIFSHYNKYEEEFQELEHMAHLEEEKNREPSGDVEMTLGSNLEPKSTARSRLSASLQPSKSAKSQAKIEALNTSLTGGN